MDEDLYDEFGNYIGPSLDDDHGDEDDIQFNGADEEIMEDDVDDDMVDDDEDDVGQDAHAGALAQLSERAEPLAPSSRAGAIVLHEDKKLYPTADEVYGAEAETLVQDEDTQPLETPIVAPVKEKWWDLSVADVPETTYGIDYLVSLMDHPEMMRNVAVVGHLQHGKTLLLDMLLRHTHPEFNDMNGSEIRYTDTTKAEQQRKISIKSAPMSFLLENSKRKLHLFNVIDTPGHPNFSDEVSAAMRVCDGVVLVVDALEGVMSHTEQLIQYAGQEGLPLILFINKIDRLVLELKLPPDDAYYKLAHVIGEVNRVISESPFAMQRVTPEKGNVVFGSALMGFSFTLQTFARIYSDFYGHDTLDYEKFAKRLWGDVFLNEETRKFHRGVQNRPHADTKRTFVHFILEPLYKIFSHTVGLDTKDLQQEVLRKIGIRLAKQELSLEVKPLFQTIFTHFFGSPKGLVDSILHFVPSPADGNSSKVERSYTGPLDSNVAQRMIACDSSGPLCMHITKLYFNPDCSSFGAFGRVMSGTVKVGDRCMVLGEKYSQENEEDMSVEQVESVMMLNGRYRIALNRAPAGSLVLLQGIDSSIAKTATVVSEEMEEPFTFRPLSFMSEAVVKVAVEPLNPSELPKMLEGLRKLDKSYPLAITRAEESGEHTVFGTGELCVDSMMHDLGSLFADIEIKVSDPVTSFCETIVSTSAIKCFSESANKKNKLTMIAEPLEKGLAEEIEKENVSLEWGKKRRTQFFEKYGWDILQANSIWAFGPENNGPNILLNETFPNEVDRKLLGSIRDSVVQGFKWGTREGPLADEPVRGCKFKLLHASISDEPISRSSSQIIPSTRRVVYSSFLTASPRMMEPVYDVDIIAPLDCEEAIYKVLERRRAHVMQDQPKPGTPLYTIKAYVPVMDSFGLEADIRMYTQGQAFCLSTFNHWSIVPGDPLDKSIVLRPLEPAPISHLAREFMVKTRRRKGLPDDVSLGKYFDEEVLETLNLED